MDAECTDQKSGIRDAIRQHVVDSILSSDADRLDNAISFQESAVLDSVGFLEVITFIEERFALQS